MPPAGKVTVLGGCGCEACDQLATYVAWLDDRIDDELTGQSQDVDVDLVLLSQPLHIVRPLSLVGDLGAISTPESREARLAGGASEPDRAPPC